METAGGIVEGNQEGSLETTDYTLLAATAADNRATGKKQDDFVVDNQELEKKFVVADLQNIVYPLDFVAAASGSSVA